MPASSVLAHILKNRSVVTYTPLRTEVAVRVYTNAPSVYHIEPRPSLDPETEAAAATNAAGDTPLAVLIPGRRFDSLGTRHGQGGGWYDRFLSHIPEQWLRVGFCFSDQFSADPLVRKSWDQVMDYVCVVSRETGEMMCAATNARSARLDP